MDFVKKVAYLKGLMDGLQIDKDSKEGKVFYAIADVLDDMALSVADLEDGFADLCEQVDGIDEDLAEVEEDLYDDDCDDCCDGMYEVTCPKCGDMIELDECMLEEDFIKCPNCGEKLEFDFDDCDCGCDCDCDHE